MKKFIVFLYFTLTSLFVTAKIVAVKVSINVNVTTGGGLSIAIKSAGGSAIAISDLTVTGIIDARDIFFMRDSMPILATINLKTARIIDYTYYPANEIPDSSFFNAISSSGKITLKSFIFPLSITAIGNSAFQACTGLSGNLSIPNYVTSIGDLAFYGCIGFNGDLKLPNSVTQIGNSAFSNCTGFKGNLSIPNSVTTIGDYAFSGCTGFHGNLNIPNSITSIGNSTFYSCSGFKGSLTIPKSITSIGTFAFFSCSGLKGNLIIPNSVVSIGNYAFYSCTGFKGNLIIPSSVTALGIETFHGCTGFNKISVSKIVPLPIYSTTFFGINKSTCSLTIPFGSKSAYQAALYWKDFLNIIEGISVVSFNSQGGSTINDTIVDTVHMIWTQLSVKAGFSFGGWYKEAACIHAWNYVKDTIKSNLTLYAQWLKINTINNLVAGKLGNTIKVNGYKADTLKQITILGQIDARDIKFMRDSMPLLSVLDITGIQIVAYTGQLGTFPGYSSYKVDELPDYSFSPLTSTLNQSNLRFIKFPNGLKSVGKNAFLNCSNLTGTLILPNLLEKIKYSAFKNCAGLTGNLTIPNTVDSIGACAFQNCTGFSGALTLSSSLIAIDTFAFYKCIGLTGDVYIPPSVKAIGQLAFFNCRNIVSITVSPDNKSYTDIGGVLYNSAKTDLLVCPAGNHNISYRMPGNVISIKASAFYNCSNLSGKIVIPNTVITIGDSAFFNCSGIDTINVPGSLISPTHLANVFYNCSNLSEVIATATNPIPISVNTFNFMNTQNCALLVPTISLATYKFAPYWQKFFKNSNITGATFVKFETNGGLAIAPVKANLNSLITAPPDSTAKTGYNFAGWYKNMACTNPWNFASDLVTSDTTLYAKWNPNNYYLSFNTNGGSNIADATVNYNTTISAPASPAKTGYTFANWYKDAAFTRIWNFDSDVVTSDIILFAKWNINTYTVTFNTEGGNAIGNIMANFNTIITLPTNPIKTGYLFAGWYKDTTFTSAWNFTIDVVTSNINLFAKWKIKSFSVQFNSNGGTKIDNITANINTTIAAPASPTKKGYSFAGWYKENSFINSWNFATDIVTSDTTLYSKWNVNSYRVSFNTLGGSTIADTIVTYSSNVNTPQPPIKTGNVFVGWYKQASYANIWIFNSDVILSDTTLFAKWALKSYTIQFYTNGGSRIPNISANYNTSITAPVTPTKLGYTFNGWYKDAMFSNSWNFGSDLVISDSILYANWTINIYKVYFNTNGGTIIADTSVNYSTAINPPKPPVKNGFTFDGWYMDQEFVSSWYFPTYVVSSNMTLYAKWNINNYTVSFNTNGGTLISDTIVNYSAKVNIPVPTLKKGYTFAGWYKDSAFINEWNFTSDSVTLNITLYANWTIDSYTVSFNSNGGSAVGNITANYNTIINAPSVPTQTGYDFAGWYKEPLCINAWNFNIDVVTANIILYAKWIKLTNIPENTVNKGLQVYPNPFTDEIEICGATLQEINIYNLLGNVVLKENGKGNNKLNINVSNFMPGIYWVRITTDEYGIKVFKVQKR